MTSQSIRRLAWDTAFFGVPIARVDLAGPTVRAAVDAAVADDIACLYVFVPGADPPVVQDAIGYGGRLVDLRVELELDDARFSSSGGRVASDADADILLPLARDLARESRFSSDPRFSPRRVVQMYEVWLRRCLDEGVVVSPEEGLGGFVGARVSDDAVSIDLVYVTPSSRGRGIASQLITRAIAETGASRARVATQAWNVAAQRLYQALGFRITGIQAIVHIWLDEPT